MSLALGSTMMPPPLTFGFAKPRTTTYTSSPRDVDFTDVVRTVRLYYLRRQYKQCAVYAVKMLTELEDKIHPIQLTFLYFFTGLAYDTLARGMPNRSPLLSGAIDAAETNFIKAQQALPTPTSRLDSAPLHRIDEHDEALESAASGSSRHSIGSQTSASAASTTATSVGGGYDSETNCWEPSPLNKLSPLHVRKYTVLPQTPSKQLTESTSLFSLPATGRSPPPKISSFSLVTPDSSPTKNESGILCQYHEDLDDFASMLVNHVSSIQAFRRTSETTIDMWRRPSSHDRSNPKEMDAEEKMLRIARGKERGWIRPRFNAQRYQDLCEKAIAEL